MRNKKWRMMAILTGVLLGTSSSLCTGCGSLVPETGRTAQVKDANTGNRQAFFAPDGEVAVMKAKNAGKAYEGSAEEFLTGTGAEEWRKEKAQQTEKVHQVQTEKNINMRKFYQDTLSVFLAEGEENTVYSPVNVYLALSMLAETADGETKEEILRLLQVEDTESLQKFTDALWNALYNDTPETKTLLANSMWLNNRFEYNKTLLERLAENYHASVFSGEMGTEQVDQALHDWLNENTKDLLKDSVDGIHTEKDMVMELLSTIYFKARWEEKFYEDATRKEVFHGKHGDATVDMMHRTKGGSVYTTNKFTGVSLGLSSGTMHFILPNENVELSDVVKDEKVMDFLGVSPVTEERKEVYTEINLSIPKFDFHSKIELQKGLQKLGVEKAFDTAQADFQPVVAGTKEEGVPIYLSKAEHAAMVKIDEEGVTGAAYTELALECGAALPEKIVDFVLDRPFYYVITGEDGSILFAGTAYDL